MPDSKYRYRPMSDPKHQIRLLKIRKGQDGLRGRLAVIDDYDSKTLETYTALSYTWGDSATDKYRIWLSDKNTNKRGHSIDGYYGITKSLHDLLVHLASEDHWSGWMWVDAICIQQKSRGNRREKTHQSQEKTQQLRKMKRTYENAENVFAWLGSGTPNSDSGMKAIEEYSHDNNTLQAPDDSGFSSWLNKHSNGIKDIFERQYWTRKWILQELAVSRNPATIACGSYRISWSAFVDIAMRIASSEGSAKRFGLQHHVWLLAQIYRHDPRQLCMSKVIYLTQEARCKNITDTVHAILGLVKMGNGTKLRLRSDDLAQKVLYRTVRCMSNDLKISADKNWSAWGRKLQRWRKQVARVRMQRQAERSTSEAVTEKDAIWEECEDHRLGLGLCHRLAQICHGHEVLYKYDSPYGGSFNCTLTRVNRARRKKS